MLIRNSSSRKAPIGIAAVALGALVGGALLYSQKQSTAPQPSPSGALSASAEPSTAPVASPEPGGQASPTGPKETMVFVRVDDEDGSHLKPVPASGEDGIQVNSPEGALNAMASMKNTPLPKGTMARSATVDKSGLAHVDFNDAFKANFTGGDTGEALALNAVVQTMGQFGAKQVQITVDGKKIDSLGGMQSLDAPLPVPPPGKSPLTQSGEKE